VKLAREGLPFAAAAILLAGICWAGVLAGVGAPPVGSPGSGGPQLTPAGVALQLAAGLTSLAAVFVLWFFRNPEPVIPVDADLVVAPGQGRIIRVEEVDEPEYLGGPARKISIFLSVFDVHVQRAPVSGTVEHKVYRPGAYAVAWADKASEDNEMASVGIAAENGKVLVRQIAGLVARRIVTDPDEGDSVERGRRFGLIRFGSRVDIFLPVHWELLCAVGDRVRVGSSVVARQRPEAA
jgi:phosphatidylserine decarboxylase